MVIGYSGASAEEATEDRRKNLVRAAEHVGREKFLDRRDIDMQAPHQRHDGIRSSPPFTTRYHISESIRTPWSQLETGIDPSDGTLQNLQNHCIGVGKARYPAGKAPVAKKETEYDRLIQCELVRTEGLGQPPNRGDSVTPP